jgi:hypothetical protein
VAKKRAIAETAKPTPRRVQRRSTRKPKSKAKATRPRTEQAPRSKLPASGDDRDILPLSVEAVEERIRHVLREILESLLQIMGGEGDAPRGVSNDTPGVRPSRHWVTTHPINRGSPSEDEMQAIGLAESASSQNGANERKANERTNDGARTTNDLQGASAFGESDVPAEDDTGIENAMAQALLRKINMVSETARAKYTVLFYLRELGDRGAFGGKTITLKLLPGENQETKRNRIWWLKNEGAVESQSRSRLERVSLTPLGRRAWDIYRAVVPLDRASGFATSTS